MARRGVTTKEEEEEEEGGEEDVREGTNEKKAET